MSTFVKFVVNMAPIMAVGGALYKMGLLDTQPHPQQHYYQQMRKEADKACWPSSNKKLDFVLALSHGT